MISAKSPQKKNFITVLAIYDDQKVLDSDQNNFGTSTSKQSVNNRIFSTLSIPVNVNEAGFGQVSNHSPSNSKRIGEEDTTIKNRKNARKSRISGVFIDAKERIDMSIKEKRGLNYFSDAYRYLRIIFSSDTVGLPMGLEIIPVLDENKPNHLLAVEIQAIKDESRAAKDGQLKIGDLIIQINELSCDQLSLARAKKQLRILQNVKEPTIEFFRNISTNNKGITKPSWRNKYSNLGFVQCKEIQLIKGNNGFGFSYAGRINAKGERIYCVKGLKGDSGLQIDDQILEIDGMRLSTLTQNQVTKLLRDKPVGITISLLINRVEQKSNENHEKESIDIEEVLISDVQKSMENCELIRLQISLNDTPGAGLGLSLKAQRIGDEDTGLFIRGILHGSAAFKDSRLKVNDRLVGIENENLLQFRFNSQALETFIQQLNQLGPGQKSVRIYVARNIGVCKLKNGDNELNQIEGHQFIRDSTARRSISEKRPMGMHKDPSNLLTYQQILHRRQISAPSLIPASNRKSLHESPNILKFQSINRQNQRPKTFFLHENVNSTSSKTRSNSKELLDSEEPLEESEHSNELSIHASKSQPESFGSVFREGDNVSAPFLGQETRRNYVGSGLLKLFGRSSSSRELTIKGKNRYATKRICDNITPSQHSQSRFYCVEDYCTNASLTHSDFDYSYNQTFFRMPIALASQYPERPGPIGPLQVSPSFYDVHVAQMRPHNSTTTAPLMLGLTRDNLSRTKESRNHWRSLPGTSRNNTNLPRSRKPSAVFYDDHWVIRC